MWSVLGTLPGVLAGSATATDFIAETLKLVAAGYGLSDAGVVADVAPAGRQVFRLRTHPRAGSGRLDLSDAPPGFYAAPPIVDELTSRFVTDLVSVALRWDVDQRNASYDPLTGVHNRRSHDESLSRLVAKGNRDGTPFALILLDVDGLKAINDRHGHSVGDTALRAVGEQLRGCLRGGDFAARVGGDEFAVLLASNAGLHDIASLLDRLQSQLSRSIPDVPVRFSAGAACFPSDGTDAVGLTVTADRRLYQAKDRSGRVDPTYRKTSWSRRN